MTFRELTEVISCISTSAIPSYAVLPDNRVFYGERLQFSKIKLMKNVNAELN